ncbi:protein KASH5 [Anolis sagrei]|uniref:protein KASH5 n=1 Tax=Anolis sagrei TaxID=38937 RepID=UPI003520C66A
MEDIIYHKSFENAAVAQLTAVLSTEAVPWDNSGVSNKNILNADHCSEENVLKCTFKACDSEQTGEVSVFRIIEYLQEMTGQSCEDWRFQSLYKRLDPEERGIAVNFSTFYAVMKDWIADCRQEGEEAADLMNSIQDLQQGNKQLAVQNNKLQRTIETAEELNSRLSEEISELKGKLRSTQQALEQARSVANELEDLKVFSKTLEEENNRLHAQTRQLEKEHQLLSVQVDNLQEENKKLLTEKENTKCKIKELFTKKASLKSKICEYEKLISCKGAALNEKTKQIEELTMVLDEYRTVVEELRLEVRRLQDHLCQSYQHPDTQPNDSLQNMKTSLQVPVQPLCMEIEESQKQEFSDGEAMPSPFCGVLPSFKNPPVPLDNIRSLAEEIVPVTFSTFQEVTVPTSTKLSSEAAFQEQALLPVCGELMAAVEEKPDGTLFEILFQWFCDVPLGHLILYILQKWMLPGLLTCGSLLAIFFLVLPYDQHPVWVEPKGANPWPQLQLRYLRPPPM